MTVFRNEISMLMACLEDASGAADLNARHCAHLEQSLAASAVRERARGMELEAKSGVIALLRQQVALMTEVVCDIVDHVSESQEEIAACRMLVETDARMQHAHAEEYNFLLEHLKQVRQQAFAMVSNVVATNAVAEAVVTQSLGVVTCVNGSTSVHSTEEVLVKDTSEILLVLARSLASLASDHVGTYTHAQQQVRQHDVCVEEFERSLRCAYEWIALEEHHAKIQAHDSEHHLHLAHTRNTDLEAQLASSLDDLSQARHSLRSLSGTFYIRVHQGLAREVCRRCLRNWRQYVSVCGALQQREMCVAGQTCWRVCSDILGSWYERARVLQQCHHRCQLRQRRRYARYHLY
jgi:hypothetical protein